MRLQQPYAKFRRTPGKLPEDARAPYDHGRTIFVPGMDRYLVKDPSFKVPRLGYGATALAIWKSGMYGQLFSESLSIFRPDNFKTLRFFPGETGHLESSDGQPVVGARIETVGQVRD
jgi:hypothetical protein